MKPNKMLCLVACLLLIIGQVLFSSQMYSIKQPAISESKTSFDLHREQDSLRTRIRRNVEHENFQVDNQLLEVVAFRRSRGGVSSFDVFSTTNIRLEPNLRLKYCFMGKGLGFKDVARIVLFIENGTHIIVSSYYVGSETPNWEEQGTRFFVFHRVGEEQNTWYVGERDIWQDLDSSIFLNEISLNSSQWQIDWVGFGVFSSSGVVDHGMRAIYNATCISLYVPDRSYVTVLSLSLSEISQVGVYGVAATIIIYCVLLAFLALKPAKRDVRALEDTHA